MAKKGHKLIHEGEYEGHPLLILNEDPDARFAFKFGVSKAGHLLEAVDELGPQAFRDFLADFVEKNQKEKKSKKKDS